MDTIRANINEGSTSLGSRGLALSGNGQRLVADSGSNAGEQFQVFNYTTPGLLGGTWEKISSTFPNYSGNNKWKRRYKLFRK